MKGSANQRLVHDTDLLSATYDCGSDTTKSNSLPRLWLYVRLLR